MYMWTCLSGYCLLGFFCYSDKYVVTLNCNYFWSWGIRANIKNTGKGKVSDHPYSLAHFPSLSTGSNPFKGWVVKTLQLEETFRGLSCYWTHFISWLFIFLLIAAAGSGRLEKWMLWKCTWGSLKIDFMHGNVTDLSTMGRLMLLWK